MSNRGFILVIYLVVVVIHGDLHVNRDTQVILVTMDLFCFSRWNTESQGMFTEHCSVANILKPNMIFAHQVFSLFKKKILNQ